MKKRELEINEVEEIEELDDIEGMEDDIHLEDIDHDTTIREEMYKYYRKIYKKMQKRIILEILV